MIQSAKDLHDAYCNALRRSVGNPARAKALLKEKGWSLRTVAPLLGVHFISLHKILNGEYQNTRVLSAIENLPRRAR